LDLLKIVVFAVAAAILVLRLLNVLGRRTGHEQQPPRDGGIVPGRSKENIVNLPNRGSRTTPDDSADTAASAAADDSTENSYGQANDDDGRIAADGGVSADASAALAQIARQDSNFDAAGFSEGAQSAFDIILNSYAAGDKETLNSLLSDEVYANFAAAMAEREGRGETLETTLIGVRKADLIEASLEGRTANVTVKFVTEQINVTRDKEDRVIAGDPNHIATVTDIWTFSRNLKSRNPNWTLVATDASN
jgi:predicted lipid-binding transport protein (Tim44 family)